MYVHLFQKPVVFTTFTGKGPLCMLCKTHLWLEDSFCSGGLRAASGPYTAAGRTIWGAGSSENDFLKWRWRGRKESPHPAV